MGANDNKIGMPGIGLFYNGLRNAAARSCVLNKLHIGLDASHGRSANRSLKGIGTSRYDGLSDIPGGYVSSRKPTSAEIGHHIYKL